MYVPDHLKKKLPIFCGLQVNCLTLGGSLGLDVCHNRYFDCHIVIYSAGKSKFICSVHAIVAHIATSSHKPQMFQHF